MNKKKSLIIVESPSKSKTINQYVGSDYKVISTMGHIRDLPKKKIGIKITPDGKFIPEYVNMSTRRKQIEYIKSEARDADIVYVASDPDREGEAIGWHIKEILKTDNIKRIVFNEITKNAVRNSLAHPRGIDINLVNAQQARRILDRLVGYEVSPILWRKIKGGLSAGRVQSVALKFIVDRERKIEEFKPEEYWTLKVVFNHQDFHIETDLTKPKLKDGKSVQECIEKIKNSVFVVSKVVEKKRTQAPAPPYITSTLQQEASRILGFSSKRTMMAAQKLYEGVRIDGAGTTKGVITYMRTDSTRVAKEAVAALREKITGLLGEKYLSPKIRTFRKKSAQDAHEAIRPTDINLRPAALKAYLKNDEYKVYNLIYNKFMMHQMADAVFMTRHVYIKGGEFLFEAKGEELLFDGFLKYGKVPKSAIPSNVEEGTALKVGDISAKQNFTKPPARYREHTLIKELDVRGIGRPSTYASIINTIQSRGYVIKRNGVFEPTPVGMAVNDFLYEWFHNVINEEFTSNMEERLDEVAAGKEEWQAMLHDFYSKFRPLITEAQEKSQRKKIEHSVKETDILCDKCGSPMLLREGRYGPFLACSNFPKCRNIKKVHINEDDTVEVVENKVRDTGVKCPSCGKGNLVERKNRKGEPFLGCSTFPKCHFAMPMPKEEKKCPECGFPWLVYKKKKGGYVCPKCGYTETEKSE